MCSVTNLSILQAAFGFLPIPSRLNVHSFHPLPVADILLITHSHGSTLGHAYTLVVWVAFICSMARLAL